MTLSTSCALKPDPRNIPGLSRRGRLQTESGLILIALLWVIVILALVALSISREVFVEAAAGRNMRDAVVARFAARAGIEDALYQLIRQRIAFDKTRMAFADTIETTGSCRITGRCGDGNYEVDIEDESGKINVNHVGERELRALVTAIGLEGRDGDIIVDSILDWWDPDSLHRLNGAEDDYYGKLNPPYRAKNGSLDAIEELLLVRGVTPENFYGRRGKAANDFAFLRYGLSHCLTIYSASNAININFAPPPVLMSIPGMTSTAARLIFERRKIHPFADVSEITRELLPMNDPAVVTYLTTKPADIYTLISTGWRSNSKARRVIRTVVQLDPAEANLHKVVYWNESNQLP